MFLLLGLEEARPRGGGRGGGVLSKESNRLKGSGEESEKLLVEEERQQEEQEEEEEEGLRAALLAQRAQGSGEPAEGPRGRWTSSRSRYCRCAPLWCSARSRCQMKWDGTMAITCGHTHKHTHTHTHRTRKHTHRLIFCKPSAPFKSNLAYII